MSKQKSNSDLATAEKETPPFLRINELIAGYAELQPSRDALVFLENGEDQSAALDYRALHQRAMAIAAELKHRGLQGERVLLLLPSGMEYVLAFFGCLYAGVVAVPAYPPRNNWHAERVAVIARDAGACATLTLSNLGSEISARLLDAGSSAAEAIIAIDRIDLMRAGFAEQQIGADTLAYLQYTSGSTGNPKGVMVRHGDLLKNCALYSAALGLEKGETLVSWLPIFHDMGLVQGIVMPLTLGGTAVFMPPAALLQKPVSWLRAISRYRAAFSGGPNFAYELCASKTAPEELDGLDLSCWRAALNAAEPISPATVRKFAEKFSAAGLQSTTLIGGFGLAEATLYVSCGKAGEAVPALWINRHALEQGRVEIGAAEQPGCQALISSGVVGVDPEVCIVDAERGQRCAPSEIGEIWVCGSSVCAGYWQLERETKETFGATLAERPGRRYMRTGDLGFIHDGQLYVTGRLKDLIIIRGANHYPQDLEQTAENSHPALRKGGWGAAFTLDDAPDAPQLVLVHEVERTARKKLDVNEVGLAVMQAITGQHGIDVDIVVLVEPAGVPKTSSGKIQRKPCKQLFLDNELREIGRWQRAGKGVPHQAARSAKTSPNRIALEGLLRDLVMRLGGLPADRISMRQPFSALGLNSLKLVEMLTELGQALDRVLAPGLAFEYPTIEDLAGYLSGAAGAPAMREQGGFEPVAIIGMSCRFPGADGPEQFWEMLKHGRSAITEIPSERSALTGFQAGAGDAFRWGGFLSDVDAFDASLFGISPREAQSIDPQQRLLLETAWHALESAGVAPNRLAGSATGVFIGVSANDYFRLQRAAGAGQDIHSGTGSALSIAANRISYCLGLQGPSMALDTACSSSLVAVHQACRSLAVGESSLALAGGVNLVLSPDYGAIFSQAQMLSPSGRCHTFGAAADGYVRGEGCGVVVLKLLRDAERDGDRILGVIRGSAVNQDGPSNGLTAPNALAQQQVIRAALQQAGLRPDAISYVETHGTGTPLGDPIEVGALQAVLDGAASEAQPPCWLGAAKPNIGHLEPAAGIAGLIKTVLVLQHGQIPPVCTAGSQNPHIDLNGSRVRIPRELVDWPKGGEGPRRAGVSSFGFGGTNAHLIVEAAPAAVVGQQSVSKEAFLLSLSANSAASLRGLASQYARLVEASDTVTLGAICEGAYRRRAHLPERLAVAAAGPQQMAQALAAFAADSGTVAPRLATGRARQRRRIAFLFTGQGAQYAGMGQGLYRSEPFFREYLDRCDAVLQPLLGHSVCAILFGGETALLDDTRYAQPAVVALELALAELLRHYGVEPEFVCGHSVGEYAAACVAGLLDLETTLKLVARRGSLMAAAPGQGAMLSVAASAQRVHGMLAEIGSTLEIAAVNAPNQLVLSGPCGDIDAALELFTRGGIDATRLKVSHAFHSRLMDPILDDFRAALAATVFRPAGLRMIPSCGTPDARLDHPDYWVEQLRQPVRFADAVAALASAGADTFVEAGPMPVLSRLAARTLHDVNWIAPMQKGADEPLHLLEALGALFVNGVELRFGGAGKFMDLPVSLPLYAFDRARHWFSAAAPASGAMRAVPATASIAGRRLDIGLEDIACFETALPNDAASYLEDHRLRGRAVMPGAAYASLMLSAAQQAGIAVNGAALSLQALEFFRPLDLTQGELRVQTILQRRQQDDADDALPGGWSARVLAWDGASWDTYASGKLYSTVQQNAPRGTPLPTNGELRDLTAFYSHWAREGLEYGPRFQGLRHLSIDAGTARASVALDDADASSVHAVLHPVLLDAAFQAVGALLGESREHQGLAPLPTSVDELLVFAVGEGVLRVEACLDAASSDRKIVADLTLYDERGTLVARVRGLHLSMVSLAALAGMPSAASPQYLVNQWMAAEVPEAQRKPWLMMTEDSAAPSLSAVQAHQLACSLANMSQFESALGNAPLSLAAAAGLIVHLQAEPEDDDPAQRCIRLCRQLQHLLVVLAGIDGLPAGFKVGVLTRAAVSIHGEQAGLAHAGAAAMLRSAALEYPQLSLCQIDLPAHLDHAGHEALSRALASDETHLAIRGGAVHAPRVQAGKMPQISTATAIRRDAAYLISGGTGGLGLALAEWLLKAGAGRIVLAARRAEADERIGKLIDDGRARGVEILLRRADLSCEADVAELFAELGTGPLPLRGIFHAAGVLRDHPLAGLEEQDWHAVINAKAASALLLDRYSRKFALDHFVLFSSIAASFGSAGQCNYAAANGLIDALAARRRQQGLCGLSINWGPWAEVGMASDAALAQRLSRQGLLPMAPRAALNAFDAVLHGGQAQAGIAALDWPRFTGSYAVLPSVLRGIAQAHGTGSADKGESLISAEALAALDAGAAGLAIRRALADLLRQVLRSGDNGPLAEGKDPRDLRLSSLGVDSLMATELRNRVRAWINVDLPAHLLIGNSSVEEVSDLIYQKVLLAYLSSAAPDADAAIDDGEEFVL